MRILIVDDDMAIRASLQMTLEYDGYDIVSAASGEEGLTRVEHDRPDLVLLDVDMPGLGGLDVLKRLHTTHERLPVVMISAHIAGATVDAMCTGAVAFLEKPFESTDLLRITIRNAVAGIAPR
jgi:DNA-binding NtrC family response regulator